METFRYYLNMMSGAFLSWLSGTLLLIHWIFSATGISLSYVVSISFFVICAVHVVVAYFGFVQRDRELEKVKRQFLDMNMNMVTLPAILAQECDSERESPV